MSATVDSTEHDEPPSGDLGIACSRARGLEWLTVEQGGPFFSRISQALRRNVVSSATANFS